MGGGFIIVLVVCGIYLAVAILLFSTFYREWDVNFDMSGLRSNAGVLLIGMGTRCCNF